MRLKMGFLFTFIALVFAPIAQDAFAKAWNDIGVQPALNNANRWYDKVSGQYISTAGMPAGYTPPAVPNATQIPITPAATTTAGTAATTATGAGATAATAATGTGTTAAGTAATTTTAATTGRLAGTAANWKALKPVQKAGKVLGAVGGAAMIYEGTAGQEKHDGWDVAGGVGGGAMAGASIGSVIPGLGTAIGAAAGAVIGGVITGSQLFSETDCLHDPVTGQFTCCNTAFNKGERQVEIGGKMFCGTDDGKIVYGQTRQCLQGGSATAASWWDGLFKDDTWAPECKTDLCPGVSEPPKDKVIEFFADTENVCWRWREGTGSGVPVQNPDGTTVISNNPYDVMIQTLEQRITAYQQQCGATL